MGRKLETSWGGPCLPALRQKERWKGWERQQAYKKSLVNPKDNSRFSPRTEKGSIPYSLCLPIKLLQAKELLVDREAGKWQQWGRWARKPCSGASPQALHPLKLLLQHLACLSQFWGHQSLKISSSWSRSVWVREVRVSGTGPRSARCCIRGEIRWRPESSPGTLQVRKGGKGWQMERRAWEWASEEEHGKLSSFPDTHELVAPRWNLIPSG